MENKINFDVNIASIQIAMQKSLAGSYPYDNDARVKIIYAQSRGIKDGYFNALLYSIFKSKNISALEDALKLGILKTTEKHRPFAGQSIFDDLSLSGYLDGFKELIKHGFSIENEKKLSESILNSAWVNNFDFYRYFLDKNYIDVSARSQYHWSAFEAFAMNNNTEALDYLLAKGYNINSNRHNDSNALNSAIRSGRNEAALFLINKGIDVNQTIINIFDHTEKRLDIVRIKKTIQTLIDAINLSNFKDKFINNALGILLLIESFNGKKRNMLSLIKKGADVNFKNKNGETPFLMAAKKCNLEVLTLLKNNNADLNYVDKNGCGAICYALQNKKVEIDTLDYLVNMGVAKLIDGVDNENQIKILDDLLRDKNHNLRNYIYSLKESLELNSSIHDISAKNFCLEF